MEYYFHSGTFNFSARVVHKSFRVTLYLFMLICVPCEWKMAWSAKMKQAAKNKKVSGRHFVQVCTWYTTILLHKAFMLNTSQWGSVCTVQGGLGAPLLDHRAFEVALWTDEQVGIIAANSFFPSNWMPKYRRLWMRQREVYQIHPALWWLQPLWWWIWRICMLR